MFVRAYFEYPMLGTGNPNRIMADRLGEAKKNNPTRPVVDYDFSYANDYPEHYYDDFFVTMQFSIVFEFNHNVAITDDASSADHLKSRILRIANAAMGDTDVELVRYAIGEDADAFGRERRGDRR